MLSMLSSTATKSNDYKEEQNGINPATTTATANLLHKVQNKVSSMSASSSSSSLLNLASKGGDDLSRRPSKPNHGLQQLCHANRAVSQVQVHELLVESILNNNLSQVQDILMSYKEVSDVVHPCLTFASARPPPTLPVEATSTTNRRYDKLSSLPSSSRSTLTFTADDDTIHIIADQIFALRRVLGDNPTLLHISVLLVYYHSTQQRSSNHNSLTSSANTLLSSMRKKSSSARTRSRDLQVERSIKICQLLIRHPSIDIGRPTTYHHHSQHHRAASFHNIVPQQLSALDWAFGLRQLSIDLGLQMAEDAIEIILDEMLQRLHHDDNFSLSSEVSNNKSSRPRGHEDHDRSNEEDFMSWGQDIVVEDYESSFLNAGPEPEPEGRSHNRIIAVDDLDNVSLEQTESRDDDQNKNDIHNRDDEKEKGTTTGGYKSSDDECTSNNGCKTTTTSIAKTSSTGGKFLFGPRTVDLIDGVASFLFDVCNCGKNGDWQRIPSTNQNNVTVDETSTSSASLIWASTKSDLHIKILVRGINTEIPQIASSSSSCTASAAYEKGRKKDETSAKQQQNSKTSASMVRV